MSGLRVLITNSALANRAGSELYVRDLATALLDRGHTPVVYSTVLGDVAREIRGATIPVVDDLAGLALSPDVIHGHHHFETMTALLCFPGVPALYFCHGWTPWEETPLRFPRILRYVAVDYTCRDRLIFEHAIPEDRIRVLLNFVDLQRFKPRAPLPARPKRALVFSNYANEGTYLGTVREACTRAGLTLDVMGFTSGNACAQPEAVLGQYDIVFAKGRAALEALAVGAAVVLCDTIGAGSMVTLSALERLRSLNFGIRTLRTPVTPEGLDRELSRYNPQDAAAVSRHIRATAGRDAVVDEIVTLYYEVLREHVSKGTPGVHTEGMAAATYLRWLAPPVKNCHRVQVERDQLRNECAQLQTERDQLRISLAAAHTRAGELEAKAEAALQASVVREGELVQAQAALATREGELGQVQAALAETQEQVAARERALEELRQALATQEEELVHTQTALLEAQTEATRQGHAAEELRQVLAAREAELGQLQITSAAAHAQAAELAARVEASQQALIVQEGELTHLRAASAETHKQLAVFRHKGRAIAAELGSFRRRRATRWLARFHPGGDLRNEITPAFQQLKDDSLLFTPNLKRFRLQPSRDLRHVPFLAYLLHLRRANLTGVLLAPILDCPANEGWLGIELVSPANTIVAQSVMPCSAIDEQVPTRFVFPPIADSHQGRFWLRVFVRDVTGPVRLFEWRKYGLAGLGRLHTRAFCGFIFA